MICQRCGKNRPSGEVMCLCGHPHGQPVQPTERELLLRLILAEGGISKFEKKLRQVKITPIQQFVMRCGGIDAAIKELDSVKKAVDLIP